MRLSRGWNIYAFERDSPALKCGDHELEMQPMVLQITPLGFDILERHVPVKLEL
jgi:hypothetical protein